MDCATCGRAVPDGLFCTVCGSDQRIATEPRDRRPRAQRFAAHPDEPVFQADVLTTLLPHLDHDRVDEFRWAALAGFGVIFLLYLVGLVTAALLAAAILVPLLYVLYLYEVRTYRDAPVPVFGATLGLGAILGTVVTVVENVARPLAPPVQGSPLGIQVDVASLLLWSLAIPVGREIVKVLPALALRRRAEFSETIDGLVLGVAAGLGFAMGQTIILFGGLFASLGLFTDPGAWIYPLITVSVVMPVLHGSSTGLIAASLWHVGRRPVRRREILAIGAAVAAQIAFLIGGQLVAGVGLGLAGVLVWQLLVVGGLLLAVRYLLHLAMLEEAVAFGFQRVTCPNCRDEVTAGGFCPSCGMALAAATTPIHAGRGDSAVAPS